MRQTLGAQLDSSGYVQVNANSGTTYQDLGTNLVGYMGSMDVIMSGYMIATPAIVFTSARIQKTPLPASAICPM